MEENMKSLDELFAGVKTAAIAGHIRPDGDCVGSCLATYNYITRRSKSACICSRYPIFSNL